MCANSSTGAARAMGEVGPMGPSGAGDGERKTVTQRVIVGRVGRRHGLDGSFVVDDASDDPRWFEVGAKLLVGDEEVEVVGARRARGRPVIRIGANAPRGARLEVAREALP